LIENTINTSSCLPPPRDIYICLSEHHDVKKTYTPDVKHAGAREYRKRILNTIAPYWKCGSGGDFHECVTNFLGAHHRQKADKENIKSHAKGEALKYYRNVVPHDFSVGLIMPFIDPNISQGKVNVTINRGPGSRPVFEKNETRSQNRRRTEEEEEKKRAAAAPKDKKFSTQEKEGREMIAANKTRRSPVLLDAKKKKKNVSPRTKFYLKLRSSSGKKKGGKKGKPSTVDLTIDEDTDSSSDESASGGSDTYSSDDELLQRKY
jgi:hypothetical protein